MEENKNSILAQLENDIIELKDGLEGENVKLRDDMKHLSDTNCDSLNNLNEKIDREIKDRKRDKVDTYADFDQICRNIDERITGEKEKLWDKIREDEENLIKI